jgi:transposase
LGSRRSLGSCREDRQPIEADAAEQVGGQPPPDRDPMNVRRFRTFTTDLHCLAEWLVACGITTVAMEATGVFGIPIYDILQERGLEVLLVNARHFRNVAGRKSAVSDAEWLQELHGARGHCRHHRTTGLRILRDIVRGVTEPAVLAKHRNMRCRASDVDIAAALTGYYRPEHVFALRQHLESFDMCQPRCRPATARSRPGSRLSPRKGPRPHPQSHGQGLCARRGVTSPDSRYGCPSISSLSGSVPT